MYGFFISFHFSFSWKLIFWDNVTWLSFGKLEGCVNSQPTRTAFNWVMWEILFWMSHKSLCWFDWHNVWFFHQICMEILTVICTESQGSLWVSEKWQSHQDVFFVWSHPLFQSLKMISSHKYTLSFLDFRMFVFAIRSVWLDNMCSS